MVNIYFFAAFYHHVAIIYDNVEIRQHLVSHGEGEINWIYCVDGIYM